MITSDEIQKQIQHLQEQKAEAERLEMKMRDFLNDSGYDKALYSLGLTVESAKPIINENPMEKILTITSATIEIRCSFRTFKMVKSSAAAHNKAEKTEQKLKSKLNWNEEISVSINPYSIKEEDRDLNPGSVIIQVRMK